MRSKQEVVNAATVLTKSSLFSLVLVLSISLSIWYLGHLPNIGKLEIWPLLLCLALGEVFKFWIIKAKRDELIKKDGRGLKTRNTKLRVRDIFRGLVIVLCMIVFYYIIAVLFGAPFLSEQEQTFIFAVLLTVLTVFPLLLNLGPDITYAILSSGTNYEGDVFSEILIISVRLTLFGAWLGAVVIPLDWDRPWQVWPIPCNIGAVCGYIASHVFVLLLHLPKIANLLLKKTTKYDL